MLRRFIEQLSEDLDLEQPLAPNTEGTYPLLLEPDLHIHIRELSEGTIALSALLAPVPEQNQEAFLLRAMAANLFGQETGGNVLGMDGTGKNMIMTFRFPILQSYKEFHDGLEHFANYAEAWRQEVVDFGEKA